jgi:hypothetical protein
LEKWNKEVEGIEGFGRGRALGSLFFFLIQNRSKIGEFKNCIGGGIWRAMF